MRLFYFSSGPRERVFRTLLRAGHEVGQAYVTDPARWPKVEPNYLYDVAHGKLVFEFKHPTRDPFQLHFSPDGRWLAFQEPLDDSKARMLIAKVDAAGRPGPSTDWIEIARGDSQAWSPMGGILYYDSDRDGSWCIWAQGLDRDTMRPIGPPSALYHAHSSRLSIGNVGQTVRGFAASRGDRIGARFGQAMPSVGSFQAMPISLDGS